MKDKELRRQVLELDQAIKDGKLHDELMMLMDPIRQKLIIEIPGKLIRNILRALNFYEQSPDGQYDLDVVVPLLREKLNELKKDL